MVDGREQSLGSARVLSNVRCFEQARYNCNAKCTSSDDLFEIVDFNSANAKDRKSHVPMHALNLLQPDRLIIRFDWRGENRTEDNVIGPFVARRQCLHAVVSGFPYA